MISQNSAKNIKISQEKNEILLREGMESDANFVIDSWCGSYRHNIVFGAIPKDIYFKNYRKFTVKILGVSRLIVACNPEDKEQIYGYLVYRVIGDMPVLSYMFVKQAFRKFGIATMMLNVFPNAKLITHIMPNLESWLKKHGCVFDPFVDMKEFYEVRY